MECMYFSNTLLTIGNKDIGLQLFGGDFDVEFLGMDNFPLAGECLLVEG